MKRFFHWLILFPFLLTACGTVAPPVASSSSQLPYLLVTARPDASATPTPFQPSLPTPTGELPVYPTYTPSPTPPATNTPFPSPTPTLDLSGLYAPNESLPNFNPSGDVPSQAQLEDDRDTINFLLIGSDKRPGGSFRTDTMIVVVLRPKEKQVSMISVPRDLWVYIPGWGMQRVNTAYQHGELVGYPGAGPGLLRDTILYNLGIRIDHTAMVEFDGFRRIVDTLGGIDVPVSCPYTDWHLIDPNLDPYNENNWSLLTVGPGIVHMDGDLALWYARSRMKSSDFDRGRRQQETLRAIYDQALSTNTLGKIPQLYNDLSSTVVTDLNLPDILQLALLAPQFTNADIRSYYIRPPVVRSWISDAGAYLLLPNQPALQNLIQEAISPSVRAQQRARIIVEVQNGTAINGLDVLAATRLNYAGYETRIIPPDRQDYGYSVVLDYQTTSDANQNAALMAVLGLSPNYIVSQPNPESQAAYRLVIGSDYQSCFKPENLAH